MSYQETAVEIKREIEKFKEARVINRFVILSILFHVNKNPVVVVDLF